MGASCQLEPTHYRFLWQADWLVVPIKMLLVEECNARSKTVKLYIKTVRVTEFVRKHPPCKVDFIKSSKFKVMNDFVNTYHFSSGSTLLILNDASKNRTRANCRHEGGELLGFLGIVI